MLIDKLLHCIKCSTICDCMLTNIMDEAFNLGLHAPVAKLNLAEFVGTHDGRLLWVIVVLFNPVIPQRTPLGLDRHVESCVLLYFILVRRDGLCYYVNWVCQKHLK